MGFINALLKSNITTDIFLYNILGNIICLVPMAFFLPLIFKKQNKASTFIITLFLITFGIELIQFLTATGTLDIDDLLLNFLGGTIAFFIFTSKSIKKLLYNIFLLDNEKLTKKDYISYVIYLFIFIILIIGLLIFTKYFKSKEYHGYEVELVDESSSCDEAEELFYEDENYQYFFNCYKSDDVYVIFNHKDKYLLKDFLNNKINTTYELSESILNNSNIGIKRVSKKEEIVLKYEGNSPVIIDEIANPEIAELENADYYISPKFAERHFLITPKKAGSTKVTFTIQELVKLPEYKTIATEEYLITVNSDLTVTYEKIN